MHKLPTLPGILGPLAVHVATTEARAALRSLRWMDAAILFSDAADALPLDAHGNITAEARSLRRSAHLALCRTPEFLRHRTRQRSRDPLKDFSQDWRNPDGSLVRLLAPQRRLSTRIVQVAA